MAIGQSPVFTTRPARIHGWLKAISLVTVLAVFALVVLGGVVRVTGSGLGCPDWPLCYGKFLPPLEFTAVIEYSHRFVASVIVSPLILVTCGIVWVWYRSQRWLTIPAVLALVLLVVQALLGGITVLQELPGEIVALHLAVAEALLGCLILLAVVAFRGPLALGRRSANNGVSDQFPKLAMASALAVYLLIISGSLVTASGATAACLSWPLCQGSLFPQGLPAAIHMGHRVVAAIVGLLVLYSVHLGFRGEGHSQAVRLLSLSVAALFVMQIVLGAVTVIAGFPIPLTALHLAMGTAVWGAISATAFVSLTRQHSIDSYGESSSETSSETSGQGAIA